MTDICVESSFGYHQAFSPAFDIEGKLKLLKNIYIYKIFESKVMTGLRKRIRLGLKVFGFNSD